MSRLLRILAALLALSLLAAACGSDREEDDATDTTEADDDGGDGGSDEAAMFGDLESPCGEGDGGPAVADEHVAADSITIGYGDDAGFAASPGLNHQMSDAMKAMINWCNEQGGINGRTIEGKYYDAKITEVNNAMLAACEEVFMLVGQGWALDASQEETRVGCGLPSVPTFSVSPEFAHGPLMYQPTPNSVDYYQLQAFGTIAEQFPDKIKKFSTMAANYSATRDSRDKVLATVETLGYEILNCPQEYNITGEADWKPFAQKLKDCGAEVVYWVGSPTPNFQNYLEAAAQLEYDPIYVVDPNFYDPAWVVQNTNGYADNTYMRVAYVPFEERDENPAVDLYLDLVEKEGGDPAYLGMQAAAAFLMWATAVDACGADVNRECVLAELAKIDEWTSGGLHGRTNPASNIPSECNMTWKVEGTKYVRVDPEEGFRCEERFVQEVTGPVVDRVELDENRVATKFQQS